MTESDHTTALPAGARGKVLSLDAVNGVVELEIAEPLRKVRVEARLLEKEG